MLYGISNDFLKVQIDSRGAELYSIKDGKLSVEYLWQGDPEYWDGRAYNMFPICGRLTEGKYICDNKEYYMDYHGFARESDFEVSAISDDSITFVLNSTDSTKSIYPFDFSYSVCYFLQDNVLTVKYTVYNSGDRDLPFTLGFHPGFNIPFDSEAPEFQDYSIVFDEPSEPKRILFSDDGFYINKKIDFPLKNGNEIPLRHDLFDNDAVFLEYAPEKLSVVSNKTGKRISVEYKDMKYIGFWHTNKSEAPFICVEPWNGMPSDYNKIDDFFTKSDMTLLKPGKSYDNTVKISFF